MDNQLSNVFVWIDATDATPPSPQQQQLFSFERNAPALLQQLLTPITFIYITVDSNRNSSECFINQRIELLRQLNSLYEQSFAPAMKAVITTGIINSYGNDDTALTLNINARGLVHIDFSIPASDIEQQQHESLLLIQSVPSARAVQACLINSFLPLLKWNEIGIIYDEQSPHCRELTTTASSTTTTTRIAAIATLRSAESIENVKRNSRVILTCIDNSQFSSSNASDISSLTFRSYSNDVNDNYVWILVPPYPLSAEQERQFVHAATQANNSENGDEFLIISLQEATSSSTIARNLSSVVPYINLFSVNTTVTQADKASFLLTPLTQQQQQQQQQWAPFSEYIVNAIKNVTQMTENSNNIKCATSLAQSTAPILQLKMLSSANPPRPATSAQRQQQQQARFFSTYGTIECPAVLKSPPPTSGPPALAHVTLSRRLAWRTGRVPLSRPACGFSGELCSSSTNNNNNKNSKQKLLTSSAALTTAAATTVKTGAALSPAVLGVLIAVAVVFVVAGLYVIYVYYRRRRREALLMRTDWRIAPHELLWVPNAGGGTHSANGSSYSSTGASRTSFHSTWSLASAIVPAAGTMMHAAGALPAKAASGSVFNVSSVSLMNVNNNKAGGGAKTAAAHAAADLRNQPRFVPSNSHSLGLAVYVHGQITVELFNLPKFSALGLAATNASSNNNADPSPASRETSSSTVADANKRQRGGSGGNTAQDGNTAPKVGGGATLTPLVRPNKAPQQQQFSSVPTLLRAFILELRAMKDAQHENVNTFLGIVLERHPSPCFAMRFCPKGALSNLLRARSRTDDDDDDDEVGGVGGGLSSDDENDAASGGNENRHRRAKSVRSIKTTETQQQEQRKSDLLLDDNIKMSFAQDICAGLRYLHNDTQLAYHGRVSSHTIQLDGRWTAKVGGYGMWKWKFDTPLESLKAETPERLLWTSPDLLKCADFIEEVDVRTFQAADVWSYGVVLSEVLYQEAPYEHLYDVLSPSDIINRLMSSNSGEVAQQQQDNIQQAAAPQEVVAEQRSPSTVKKGSVKILPKHSPIIETTAFGSHVNLAAPPIVSDGPVSYSEQVRLLMLQCWHENANLRPNFAAIARTLRTITHGRPINIVDSMIAKMESYTNNLEALVAARTVDLREQQARADELLSRMMPNAVAERLKAGLEVEPEYFDACSIFFSDIVKFTVLASHCSPYQVVALLNSVYVFMDSVMAKYDVYKVETIGDSYMVVSGVPQRTAHHASEISSMALEIRDGLSQNVSLAHLEQQLAESVQKTLHVRIGIHSGTCVAGVVGLAMPRYCLFGDSVNTASRMESHGVADKIQLSDSTCKELVNHNTHLSMGGNNKDTLGSVPQSESAAAAASSKQQQQYEVEPRGLMDIKGKGEMMTFWLLDGPVKLDDDDGKALTTAAAATNKKTT